MKIKEILEKPDKTPLNEVVFKVKGVFKRNVRDDKFIKTLQNVLVEDNTGTAYVEVINRDDVSDWKGKTVLAKSSDGKFGLSGVARHDFTFDGKLNKKIRIAKSAIISFIPEKNVNAPAEEKKEVDWDGKDLRISKLSCISSAIEFAKNRQDITRVAQIILIAEMFREYVYGEKPKNEIASCDPYPYGDMFPGPLVESHDIRERDAQCASEDQIPEPEKKGNMAADKIPF